MTNKGTTSIQLTATDRQIIDHALATCRARTMIDAISQGLRLLQAEMAADDVKGDKWTII